MPAACSWVFQAARQCVLPSERCCTDVKRLRPEATLDGIAVEPMAARPHAREVLLGMTSDPVLGPVIVFGAGGVDVEASRIAR